MAPDATVQVRRIVQLHARADDALASYALLHCVSRACSLLEQRVGMCTRPAHASPPSARPWIARLMSAGRFCASAGACWLLDKRARRAEDPFVLSHLAVARRCIGASLDGCASAEAGLIPPPGHVSELRVGGRGYSRPCGHVAALSRCAWRLVRWCLVVRSVRAPRRERETFAVRLWVGPAGTGPPVVCRALQPEEHIPLGKK